MGRAIDLDNQPHLVTGEIDDKSAACVAPIKGVSPQMSDRFAIFAPRI
jgi:hypothetical protein